MWPFLAKALSAKRRKSPPQVFFFLDCALGNGVPSAKIARWDFRFWGSPQNTLKRDVGCLRGMLVLKKAVRFLRFSQVAGGVFKVKISFDLSMSTQEDASKTTICQ
jgi:hypothetical protein